MSTDEKKAEEKPAPEEKPTPEEKPSTVEARLAALESQLEKVSAKLSELCPGCMD